MKAGFKLPLQAACFLLYSAAKSIRSVMYGVVCCLVFAPSSCLPRGFAGQSTETAMCVSTHPTRRSVPGPREIKAKKNNPFPPTRRTKTCCVAVVSVRFDTEITSPRSHGMWLFAFYFPRLSPPVCHGSTARKARGNLKHRTHRAHVRHARLVTWLVGVLVKSFDLPISSRRAAKESGGSCT